MKTRNENEYKVIIFGNEGYGKAELVKKYMHHDILSDTSSSIGVDFGLKKLEVDGRDIVLKIWNLSGEKKFRTLVCSCLENTRGAIFLYDVANYTSISDFGEWLRAIKKEGDQMFPIIAVGNTASSKNREISRKEAEEIAKLKGLDAVIECNTLTGENTENVFISLSKLMLGSS